MINRITKKNIKFNNINTTSILFHNSWIIYVDVFYFNLFLVASYEWHKMTKRKAFKIYGFPFIFFLLHFYELSLELNLVFFVILICIATDIGGYIFGKMFKGPKLTKISPNKTYAGMIGGYFCL